MAAVALPDWPWPASMTEHVVTSRAEQTAPLGGATQRLNRMGSRHALDVTLPVMPYVDAQDWSAIDDESATVSLIIRQPGLVMMAPGLPRVAGAAQSGSTLNLDGLTPGFVMRRRQWLSISTGDRWYAYRAKAETRADASGVMALPLTTMLRTPPADNDVIEISQPRIEGFATVPKDAWTIDTAGHVALSFTLTERV